MSIVKKRVQTLISNLSKDFALDKLSKSPARFNTQKLDWFNRQYISMLGIEEFALRCFKNRIQNTFKSQDDKRYRVGDYVYFVDIEQNLIYINKEVVPTGQDGLFYPIGGGRNDLGWEDNLQKEVLEETAEKLVLDMSKVLKITHFKVHSQTPFQSDGQTWDGKEMHLYFYPIKKSQLKRNLLEDGGQWLFDWYPLEEVLTSNQFLNLPVFKEFCLNNSIDLKLNSNLVQKAYLAWFLDKQRITVLSEFGVESSCILDWQKPQVEDIKWKKISLEESQDNLRQIQGMVTKIYHQDKFIELQKGLYESTLSTELEIKFQAVTDYLETEIKSWLNQNQYQPGNFLWPLRVALSGKLKSPSPFEILAILDTNEVNKRLDLVLHQK
jgi:glutamyl/glutaminyl-tRNA synthetase